MLKKISFLVVSVMALQANVARSSEQNWSFGDINDINEPFVASVSVYFYDKAKENFALYTKVEHEIVDQKTTVLDIKTVVCALLNGRKKFFYRSFKANQMSFFVGGAFSSKDSQKIYGNMDGQAIHEGARVYVKRKNSALRRIYRNLCKKG